MRFKYITNACVALAFGTCALASQASNDDVDHRWMPKKSSNNYWQAPDRSGFSRPPSFKTDQPPARPARRAPYPPAYNFPAPANRPAPPVRNTARETAPPPPSGPYRGTSPARPDSGTPPARPYSGTPPARPYSGTPPARPYSGPSAFYQPGYNPYRKKRRSSNKFWGRSGPSTWMNPGKGNWENSWDDMINAPSRMGEMPGGWTAPEVTVPNPIDMGDQIQDNVKDLPDQMRDGNIGNNVTN